jgi:hypothetical protein
VAHERVAGEGLRTTYTFAPHVVVSTLLNGPTAIQLEYAASPVHGAVREFIVTRLDFEHVVAYEWNAFEFHRHASNPDDVEFRLIEILDSPIVSEIRSSRRYIGATLRHFRITFDDHGTYDIVCEAVHVSQRTAIGEE